ncbi:ATP-binding protein [Streptomyces tsukubensis]
MCTTTLEPETPSTAGFEVRLNRSGKAGDPLTDEDRLWPGLMRYAAQAHTRLWRLDHLADAVDLIVSELVTNALVHGEGAVDIRMWRTDKRLFVEVGSASPRVPRMRESGPLDENGRGLHLVAVLADGWGVTAGGAWCALRVDREAA